MLNELISIVGKDSVFQNEVMSRHTTFKVGGPADYLVTPSDISQVREVIYLCKRANVPYYVIGNGSNLIVKDLGYRGIIIQLYKKFADYKIEDNKVCAKAGIMLSKLAKHIYEAELTGFEFASGIPGTLGGAVTMNAGAYGGEIKDVISSATVLDNEGNIITLSKEELELSYRKSVISEKQYIMLEAELIFEKGDKEKIKECMDEFSRRRIEKQPLEFPSAGSTFKRPEGYFAGKLIMDTGLAGYMVGGAKVSEKHCGFVINAGNATASDILDLIKDVQEKVYDKFEVKLETEVKVIGD